MVEPIRLSAHIGFLFKELPLERRIDAAREAGFDAVEHPEPFEIPAARMRDLIDASGVGFTQLGVAASRRGLACFPDLRQEFRDLMARSLDYAEEVGCRLVHPMAGIVPRECGADLLWATYYDNMAHAIDRAAARGISIIIEPHSPAGTAGYLINSTSVALEVVGRLGLGRAMLLLDSFHCWAGGEDFSGLVQGHVDVIGHIHAAGHPGRNEPDSGEHDLGFLLPLLAKEGYRGAVGFEYIPAGETTAGLGWLREWRSIRDAQTD